MHNLLKQFSESNVTLNTSKLVNKKDQTWFVKSEIFGHQQGFSEMVK